MTDEQATRVEHLRPEEGLPIKPDVDLLLKTWPDPKVGDIFPYAEIEQLLRVEWRSARFHTVTYAWRTRMLREKGCVVESSPGRHFYAADAVQVCSATHGILRFVGRKAHRQRKKLTVVPHDESQRPVVEHQSRLMLAVEREAKKLRMNLLPPTEVPERPRIGPPTQQDISKAES